MNIEDNKKDAQDFTCGKRHIIPKAYCEKKKNAASFDKNEAQYVHQSDDDDDDETPLTKVIQQMQCAQKMKAMDNLTINLAESDIDDIQDILDDSMSDEEQINADEQSPDNTLHRIESEHGFFNNGINQNDHNSLVSG